MMREIRSSTRTSEGWRVFQSSILAKVGRALFFAASVCRSVHADTLHEGGRDVTVSLFSTHTLHRVTIAPVHPGAWIASCAACTHKPLTAQRPFDGSTEIFAGGSLRVTDEDTHEERVAAGLWHLRSSIGGIDVVLTLPSERYVAAVLNAEPAANEPQESLQALAIVARTYALNGKHFTAHRGHLQADLCDSTQCQAIRLGHSSSAVEDAVRATAGETLWFGAHRAQVYYSQHCGGVTEDARVVWPRLLNAPYLDSHPDPFCVRRTAAAWHAEIALTDLAAIAAVQGWNLPSKVTTARVLERSRSRRALRIEFQGKESERAIVDASALHFGIDRALGWNRIRSEQYSIAVRNGSLVFDGHGYGHGVGLCQTGASEMAAEHNTAREIVAYYFPHTTVRITPEDEGWQTMHSSSITVQSTRPIDSDRARHVEQIWKQAQERFPAQAALMPEIFFAPSTELFRQLTSQPGWMLASTSGFRIVLQPLTTLRAKGVDADSTLLHEMLHALVESEAGVRAPLWLREGLVEDLSESHRITSQAALKDDAIDAALLHSDSRTASESAHKAAEAKVHGLIVRYGLSVVRGWLKSGVPVGIA